MTNTDGKHTVREAIAVFADPNGLKNAVKDLQAAGINRDQIGLLASENSIRESLGDFYTQTNDKQSGKTPMTAFVGKDDANQLQDSIGGSLFFVGTSGAMGAVVASSAIFGGALLAALSGVVAVGAIGALAGKIILQSDADYLQQQVDDGHVLLFVRVIDASREQDVIDILSRHDGQGVKIHEIKQQNKSK